MRQSSSSKFTLYSAPTPARWCGSSTQKTIAKASTKEKVPRPAPGETGASGATTRLLGLEDTNIVQLVEPRGLNGEGSDSKTNQCDCITEAL